MTYDPGIPAGAILDVVQLRRGQIYTHGHTAEADAGRAIEDFTRDLVERARATHESAQFHKGNALIRRRLVTLAALAVATIDRIDMEGESQL